MFISENKKNSMAKHGGKTQKGIKVFDHEQRSVYLLNFTKCLRLEKLELLYHFGIW